MQRPRCRPCPARPEYRQIIKQPKGQVAFRPRGPLTTKQDSSALHLLQKAYTIFFTPMFHNLAVCDSHNVNASEGYLFTRWLNAYKFARMGTCHLNSCNDLIPFRNHILDDRLVIGKTS